MHSTEFCEIPAIFRTLPLFDSTAILPTPSPLPMQYLGSKSRIANWIISSIIAEFPEANRFFDLFSGSGSISCAALNYYPEIITNDIQPYSYIIQQSLFCEPRVGLDLISKEVLKLGSIESLLSDGRENNAQLYLKEKSFFNGSNFAWEDYQRFCNETNIIDGLKDSIDKLKTQQKHNLFISYYANTYFGVQQCLELDALRLYANKLPSNLKTHLIAAVISSMTYAVSSTTHLAQYLRPSNANNSQKLIQRRQKSIVKMVSDRLLNLFNFPMPSKQGIALNFDYLQALESISADSGTIVYIDPPYFKEHYSRYYHVLDTFALYDFPFLTYNPRLQKVTQGRYREDRFTSDFGLRSSAANAFEKAFLTCNKNNFSVAVSYANTSLISRDCIIDKANKAGYKVRLLDKELMHSGQGQPRNRKVTEYLFLLNRR